VVVEEYDVVVCPASVATVCVLGHPLRPPWRPYNYDDVKKLRMKPQAHRLEVDLPLSNSPQNYNSEGTEGYKQIEHVTLRSQQVGAWRAAQHSEKLCQSQHGTASSTYPGCVSCTSTWHHVHAWSWQLATWRLVGQPVLGEYGHQNLACMGGGDATDAPVALRLVFQVEQHALLALGVIQDGKLLLAPVDMMLQMRPNLAHLNVMKKGARSSHALLWWPTHMTRQAGRQAGRKAGRQ
jgi:hypothetical protein